MISLFGKGAENIAIQAIKHVRAMDDHVLVIWIGNTIHQVFEKLDVTLIQAAVRSQIAKRVIG